MRTLRIIAEQPVGLVIGFAIASILFLAAFGLALTSGRVLATHDASGNMHACVSPYTGQARFMAPGQAPNCNATEQLVEWPGSSTVGDLEARVQALEDQVPDCMASEGDDAVFEGCNVHVRNGEGSTETTNGSGNLIVGYNENQPGYARGGSHNIVAGTNHGYESYGGLVAGQFNRITGVYASVTGGFANEASGEFASVTGGSTNEASGWVSSVSAGTFNVATAYGSSVSGGFANQAIGDTSSVSGGSGNRASDITSSVSGGQFNEASGEASSVGGGFQNTASGDWSSVSGGANRATDSADPDFDWRGGGLIEDS